MKNKKKQELCHENRIKLGKSKGKMNFQKNMGLKQEFLKIYESRKTQGKKHRHFAKKIDDYYIIDGIGEN